VDIVVATTILLLPLMLYIHIAFEDLNFEFTLFGKLIVSKKSDLFIWHFLLRFIPILLFTIWFLTSFYKWRYLIFIPIILFTDSLIRQLLIPSIFNDYSTIFSILITVFISVGLVVSLLFLHKLIRIYSNKPTAITVLKFIRNNPRNLYSSMVSVITKVKERKEVSSPEEYLCNLTHINSLVNNEVERFADSYKTKLSGITTTVIYVSFLIMPIFFNIHLLIPEKVKSFSYGPIILSNYGFQSIDILVWLLFLKVTYLLTLSIWFITSLNWWKYAILSPIVLVSYQIWEMFQDVRYIDAWGNLRAFPFILFNIVTLLVLSNYIKYEFKVSDLQEAISRELDEMIGNRASTQQIDLLRDQLRLLKANPGKKGRTAEKNLEALIKMREQLLKDLEVNC
jgi:hypothetical protein